MHLQSTLLVLATTVTATVLDTRQSNAEAYINQVCSPEVASGPLPPCVSIDNIETACKSSDLVAYAKCMCTGSFFRDWVGCLSCRSVHGAVAPPVSQVFLGIISTVSNQLCTGTPTASFPALFASVQATAGAEEAAQGVTASDRFPSQTAVSLYYTATGSQGPGSVTGSAAQATNTGSVTSTGTSTGRTGATTLSGTVSSTSSRAGATQSSSRTSAGVTGATTSSSTAGARETGVWMGALGVIAGGAALVAL